MKAEECRADEKVIHRMKFDLLDGSENEEEEEKEKERDRRGEADLAYPGAGIELARHNHAYLDAGEQVRILPCQFPPLTGLFLAGRRNAARRKIYLLEISVHDQREILDLIDIFAEVIPPLIQPRRFISH